jgi:hypothetical protein
MNRCSRLKHESSLTAMQAFYLPQIVRLRTFIAFGPGFVLAPSNRRSPVRNPKPTERLGGLSKMRVTVFLFAAITAALTLPAMAKARRPVETPDAETEQPSGGEVNLGEYDSSEHDSDGYDNGYGFAPVFEPDARRWKQQWAVEELPIDLRKPAGATAKARGLIKKLSPKRQPGEELPTYSSFAEPAFVPPWLNDGTPSVIDAAW